uniref:PHB domain-containing protein n=1 Tax=Macrostomum lignano TaxID=282301 RepID=A0A1I8FAD6_9PLAT
VAAAAISPFVRDRGWGWAWWWVTEVQTLTLEVMTLTPVCENVETSEGVPVTVTDQGDDGQRAAADCLPTVSGKSRREIENSILQTMEGHLRAILAPLSVESIYKDRDRFADLVREMAAPDVGRMGIEILSFTIKDVYDKVEYLNSLGRTQVANVKRDDADIGVAQAERDAGIKEAESERARLDVKYVADSQIADSARQFQMQKAAFDTEVNKAKAEAPRSARRFGAEEIEIEVREKRKLIEIEEKELCAREGAGRQHQARPAEAEAFKVQNRGRRRTLPPGQGGAGRGRGHPRPRAAEAASIGAVGRAQAEEMRLKAAAYRAYGDAAILEMSLEALPRWPPRCPRLTKLWSLRDDRTTSEVSRLLSNLPPAVQALTGVDLSGAVGKLAGLQTA